MCQYKSLTQLLTSLSKEKKMLFMHLKKRNWAIAGNNIEKRTGQRKKKRNTLL